MKFEIRPTTAAASAVLSDEDAIEHIVPARAELKKGAHTGELFLMCTDDPIFYRIDLFIDEDPDPETEELFGGSSGSYLLRAPTGRLHFTLAEPDVAEAEPIPISRIDVPPGDYAVSVRDRNVADVAAHNRHLETEVGAGNWRFYERVNWLRALGCLTLVLGVGLSLLPFLRTWFPLIFGFSLVPSFVGFLLSLLPRFRHIRQVERKFEESLAGYLLILKPVSSAQGLAGGWHHD